jgi:methionine-rich copper-binding protein CopC
MKSTLSRVIVTTGLAVASFMAVPLLAQAHATLVKCNVKAGAVLTAAPKTVTCTFAEGVNPKGSFVGVFEATGDKGEVDRQNSAVSFSNAHQMTIGLPKLGKGSYNLIWFTISADDGHRAGGNFTFNVK